MRLVIVESPYAGDIEHNVRYARCAMAECLRSGEAPFASHLLYTQPGVLRDDDPAQRKLGITAGFAWRKRSDATIVFTDLGISAGMRAGIRDARSRGHRVEYRSLADWASDTSREGIECRTCFGRGAVLHMIPRPGGPPGNQDVPCSVCEGTGLTQRAWYVRGEWRRDLGMPADLTREPLT